MLLAGFVKAETPASVKLKILENILENHFEVGNYAEEFKTNLVGLTVSEVEEKEFVLAKFIQFPQSRHIFCARHPFYGAEIS